ncbi:MAG: MATE family efflux transporter [Solobacterium sp.]|nr:MATE family efflux transporter [Solobacterium sp.]
MSETKGRENRLGTMPVGRLLISMAVPMMLSFFIQALYNIVDSMFVAHISENALTAVSLAFPMQQVMNAIGVGTGVGISAGIPRAIAQKRKQEADDLANTGIFLCLCYVAVFALLGIFFAHRFYLFQTDVEEIVTGGTAYLSIVWILGAGVFFGNFFEKMLTGTGNASLAMAAQASGAIFNIIFDPLLIFGIGPFPEMGIAGAALATVLGQILAGVIAFWFNMHHNEWVSFHVKEIFHPKWRAAKKIYTIGIPSMITIGLSSMSSFFINQILLQYSTTATAVYGIWLKLQNFCFMPAFGMNNGMVPILSYNYGAKRFDRVWGTLKYALSVIVPLMIVLTVVLECIPSVILQMFNASENLMGIGMTALRFCVFSLGFGGACIVLTSAMQALSHAKYTLIVNVLRGFVLPVSSFFLLSELFHELSRLWIAVPLADVLAFLISLLLFRKMRTDLAAGQQS